MRSDATYERLVKLWTSVWNLVLENKRVLEEVTATLQRIVFEQSGWPGHKNWPEICKLGETNKLMMMAIAMMDIATDQRRYQVMVAFPECFCGKPVRGPYPLSALQARARQNASHIGPPEYAAEQLETYQAIPSDVPVFNFDLYGRNPEEQDFPQLPKGIDPNAKTGDIVTWDGKSFVVVESHPKDLEEMTLVPAECIRIDL